MPRPEPREGLFPPRTVDPGDRSAQAYTKQKFKAKTEKVLSALLFEWYSIKLPTPKVTIDRCALSHAHHSHTRGGMR